MAEMKPVPVETLNRIAAVLEDPKAEHPHDVSYLIEEVRSLAASPQAPARVGVDAVAEFISDWFDRLPGFVDSGNGTIRGGATAGFSDVEFDHIALATDLLAALTPREEAPAEWAGERVWLDVRDAPQDGSPILLNHRTHGIIQGWFSKGEWSDDTPISPREYSGDMWILGDDLYQDDVEFGEGGVVLPSGVLGWLPLSALRARTSEPEAGEYLKPGDLFWGVCRAGHVAANAVSVLRSNPEKVDLVIDALGRLKADMDSVINDPSSTNAAHPSPATADKLRVAVEGIDADYMTSETHHPGYVLIPTSKFEAIRQALATLSPKEGGGV